MYIPTAAIGRICSQPAIIKLACDDVSKEVAMKSPILSDCLLGHVFFQSPGAITIQGFGS